MAFTELLKSKIRRRAHFQCCLCKALGVEIHHIVPQEEGGPDTEENAAPLCPSCHETYGANPKKRKFIREARDLWYEICEKRYTVNSTLLIDIKKIVEETASRRDLDNFKEEVLAAIKEPSLKNKRAYIEVGLPIEEGSGEVVRALSIDDLLVLLYNMRSERSRSQYGLLLLEEFWPEEHGFARVRNEFLKLFGERAAEKLAMKMLDELDISNEPGLLTEEEIEESLSLVRVEMALMLLANSGDAEARLGDDGALLWKKPPSTSQ